MTVADMVSGDGKLIAQLQALIERLEAENDALRRALQPVRALPRWLGLSPTEEAIVSLLMTRDRVSYAQIYDVLYVGKENYGDVNPKIMNVWICKIRKKLKPHAIDIETMWSIGLSMPVASRDRLKAFLAGGAG